MKRKPPDISYSHLPKRRSSRVSLNPSPSLPIPLSPSLPPSRSNLNRDSRLVVNGC